MNASRGLRRGSETTTRSMVVNGSLDGARAIPGSAFGEAQRGSRPCYARKDGIGCGVGEEHVKNRVRVAEKERVARR